MRHSLLFQRLASSLVAASLALACGSGDDDSGRSVAASCDGACNRAHECDSAVDVQTCANACKNDTAAVGPKLSSEFLAGVDACVAALDCAEIALASVYNTCTSESSARLAPSAAATSLCDAVVASYQECAGLGVSGVGCLNGVKIFNDSALAGAETCKTKPCDQRWGCLQTELGMDLSPATP